MIKYYQVALKTMNLSWIFSTHQTFINLLHKIVLKKVSKIIPFKTKMVMFYYIMLK